jgi:transposase
MEETGCYGRALAAFLHQAGHHVSLVNAALIKSYGQSRNLRNKNDTLDARLIANYTLERVPPRWVPLSGSHQKLRELARRRLQLMEFIIAEKNHLEAAMDKTVRAHVSRCLSC